MSPVSILPARLDGLSFTLPPGEYLLPWTWTDAQRSRMVGVLAQGLGGVRYVLSLDWNFVHLSSQQLTGTTDVSILSTRVPAGRSDAEVTRALRPFQRVRYRFVQREDPQLAGYLWQERFLKPVFVPWLQDQLADPTHPLAGWGAARIPVGTAAGLCEDILTLIELIEETLNEQLRHASRSWQPLLDIDWSLSTGRADLMSALATKAEEIRAVQAESSLVGPLRTGDLADALLRVAGARMGRKLATLAAEPELASRVIGLVGSDHTGPVAELDMPAAAALERLGLARLHGSSLSLGPLARRARTRAVWGGLVVPLAESGLPCPQPPERPQSERNIADRAIDAVGRQLRRTFVLPRHRVIPCGADLSRWLHELARLMDAESELQRSACAAVEQACELLEAGQTIDATHRTEWTGLVATLQRGQQQEAGPHETFASMLAAMLHLAMTVDDSDGRERLRSYYRIHWFALRSSDEVSRDLGQRVLVVAWIFLCAGTNPFVTMQNVPDVETFKRWMFQEEGGARLFFGWLTCVAGLFVRGAVDDDDRSGLGEPSTLAQQFEQMIGSLVRGGDHHPFLAPAIILFETLLRAGDWEHAQRLCAYLYRAAEGPPTPLGSRALMCLVLYFGSLDAFAEADRCLERLTSYPAVSRAWLYYLRGWLSWRQQKTPESIEHMISAIAIVQAPEDKRAGAFASLFAAHSFLDLGEVESCLLSLHSVDPNHDMERGALTMALFGAVAMDHGRPDAAAAGVYTSWLCAGHVPLERRALQHQLLTRARRALGDDEFFAILLKESPEQLESLRTFLDAPPPPEPSEPPQRRGANLDHSTN